jgi:hypothetical protein
MFPQYRKILKKYDGKNMEKICGCKNGVSRV